MPTLTLKLYPSWNTQKPPIPPRSRLYNLEPIGIGTHYVESLTGYVIRLAEQHCITTRQLLLNEIAPLMGRERKLSNSRNESISKILGVNRDRTATNGTGLTAANLVHAMSALTKRTDLHFLTLRPWVKVLSKRGLLRHERAWCPFCYQEWRDTNKSIYEPLLWCINIVDICSIHHHPFLSVCPHCLAKQLVLSGDSQTGHCNKCGKWLGSSQYKSGGVSKMNSSDEIAWQLHVNHELGDLIAAAPTIKSPLNSNRISNTISNFINQVFQSNQAALSRAISVNEATIGSWCKGKVIPQIDKVLLLSHQMRIKLLDFLTTDVLVFDNITCGSLTTQADKPRKAYKRINSERKQVLNIVLQEVTNEYPPPSLEDVALRLKYRPLFLQNHFPSLCQIIRVRHADYKSVSKQQKIQPVLELALQEFPPPSFQEISRRLGYKNNSYLYRYFPELSRSISKRYKEYNKAIGEEKRELVCQEIQNVAQLLHSQGQKPTQRRVTQLLTKPGVMRNLWVRSYLREVQQSFGYD
ncbi:TniQ family protein [Scytonema hofmannii FACHB-248]|uniref:TniQ family protein n=1 Tax=Scytonema hofmannii FACHB-248 TaxID=1842502 RepID=A0ABR8GRK6_9CYAN|nr:MULTISPECIES: TniQ family protein [Nostocales]MBD2605768.1 TniQ family protein [Scytonema hofmannii FACHB-248]